MLWQAVLCCGGVGVSIGAGTALNAGKLAPAFSAFMGVRLVRWGLESH